VPDEIRRVLPDELVDELLAGASSDVLSRVAADAVAHTD
jgi:hypothetical protein